jgi:homoaconitase/3-isopropylmalate dehydratase large subunit
MAKTWQEVRKNIQSVSDDEKAEFKRQVEERARKIQPPVKLNNGRDVRP